MPDVLELKGVKNVATSYVSVNGQLQKDKSWNLPLSEGWSRYREAIRPAGAICSTVNDMAKFAIFHLNKGEFHGRRLLKARRSAKCKFCTAPCRSSCLRRRS